MSHEDGPHKEPQKPTITVCTRQSGLLELLIPKKYKYIQIHFLISYISFPIE